MVHLRRGQPPDQLPRLHQTWTERWLRIWRGERDGDWATAVAKKTISSALQKLAHRKCAFCEGKLELTSYLEIEHYWAKSIFPGRAFDWSNLFPICRLCNNAKLNVDHGDFLIKPDVDSPEDLLWLNPDSGKLERSARASHAQCERVERTVDLCDLQRGALCDERILVMESTIRWLERVSERRGLLNARLREEWNQLSMPTTPYKFVIRHVLATRGEPRLAQRDRDRFEERS